MRMTHFLPEVLTQHEIDRICFPLRQHGAQARWLRRQGLIVRLSPGGQPLVLRSMSHAMLGMTSEIQISLTTDESQPDRLAMLERMQKRKNKVGKEERRAF